MPRLTPRWSDCEELRPALGAPERQARSKLCSQYVHLFRRSRDQDLAQHRQIRLQLLTPCRDLIELQNVSDDVEVDLIAKTVFLLGWHGVSSHLEFFRYCFSDPSSLERLVGQRRHLAVTRRSSGP